MALCNCGVFGEIIAYLEISMVKIIQKAAVIVYQCEECGLKYQEEKTAQECQAWCAEHKSCNLGIIKNAVEG